MPAPRHPVPSSGWARRRRCRRRTKLRRGWRGPKSPLMVEELFRQDAYLKQADATVTALEERGLRLDRSIFYPTGGGQPGDTGILRWDGGEARVIDAVKADGSDVLHVLAPDSARPPVGTKIEAALDWDRRLLHMRMRTALHVMSAVIKGNVTVGQAGADKSRLDFNLEGTFLAKNWVTE